MMLTSSAVVILCSCLGFALGFARMAKEGIELERLQHTRYDQAQTSWVVLKRKSKILQKLKNLTSGNIPDVFSIF